MITLPQWKQVHMFLVKHKQHVLTLFTAAYIFCVVFIVAGFYLFTNNTSVFWFFNDIAGTIGSLALLLFLATLIPGIMSRFKVFPLITASMIMFRRQIGILMFLTALVHSFYVSTIPALMTNTFVLGSLPVKSLYGVIAMTILMPVWITSNDISVKKLGKFWKMVQRLSYFALLAIFMHAALNTSKLAILAFIVIGLEAASWIKVWFFGRKRS